MTCRLLASFTAAWVLLALPDRLPAYEAPPGNDDIAVQTRGPVHEAYAQPQEAAPQSGPIVPKQPPDPVSELPPEQKPEGDNVRWMPGYWAWDADRNDYLWVSGFWRVLPPERRWIAGYWRPVQDGWQWVPGYWAPDALAQPQYLEPPPAPLDVGPTIPAPDDNSSYVPGVWVFRAQRYVWRPGYWRPHRPGWLWSPAHYVWTPNGYIFVDGFWDRCLEDRGVLFAPVVFPRPYWATPGWTYRPRFVVSIGTPFFSAFFVRPTYGHYYFGDYYDSAYLRLGYQPWFVYGPRFYDPLFGYYRWHHRRDSGWHRGLADVYVARRAGDLPRPPRTLVEQTALLRQPPRPGQVQIAAVVSPLSEFRGNLRLARASSSQLAEQQAAAQRLREAARQRAQIEKPSERGRTVAQPPLRAATPPAVKTPGGPPEEPRLSPRTEERPLVGRPQPLPPSPGKTPPPAAKVQPPPLPPLPRDGGPKGGSPPPAPRRADPPPVPRDGGPKIVTPPTLRRADPPPVPRDSGPKIVTPPPAPAARSAPPPIPRDGGPKIVTPPTPRRADPPPVPRDGGPRVVTPPPAPAARSAPPPAPSARSAPPPVVVNPTPRSAPPPPPPQRLAPPPPRSAPPPPPPRTSGQNKSDDRGPKK